MLVKYCDQEIIIGMCMFDRHDVPLRHFQCHTTNKPNKKDSDKCSNWAVWKSLPVIGESCSAEEASRSSVETEDKTPPSEVSVDSF